MSKDDHEARDTAPKVVNVGLFGGLVNFKIKSPRKNKSSSSPPPSPPPTTAQASATSVPDASAPPAQDLGVEEEKEPQPAVQRATGVVEGSAPPAEHAVDLHANSVVGFSPDSQYVTRVIMFGNAGQSCWEWGRIQGTNVLSFLFCLYFFSVLFGMGVVFQPVKTCTHAFLFFFLLTFFFQRRYCTWQV